MSNWDAATGLPLPNVGNVDQLLQTAVGKLIAARVNQGKRSACAPLPMKDGSTSSHTCMPTTLTVEGERVQRRGRKNVAAAALPKGEAHRDPTYAMCDNEIVAREYIWLSA